MTAFWLKPEDHVPAEGFRPLEELAARVAEDPTLPSLDPDHFLYAARVERAGFPVLHVYRHVASRKFLNVDEFVDVWRYTSSDKVGSQRYAPYQSVAEALEAIDLFRGNLVANHLGSVVRAAEAHGVTEPVAV